MDDYKKEVNRESEQTVIEKRKEYEGDERKENWPSGIDPNEHKDSQKSDYSEGDGTQ